MKRVGQSLILRRFEEPAPQHFYISAVRDDFIPTKLSDIPFNAITIDGTAATSITINSDISTVIVRD